MESSRRTFLPKTDGKMSFDSDVKRYLEQVEQWIKGLITIEETPEKKIHEAMNYSLLAGGKRLRPILSMAVCQMLGGKTQEVLPFACAIELIHTYSLIHDDLPCMDNDDMRRGRPTNHKVYGEAMALLAGDGLLNLAFETLLKETLNNRDNQEACLKAAHLIACASGTGGMIGGQVMDMEAEERKLTYEELCTMHRKKTGALIKVATLVPAILLNAGESVYCALESYSLHIGLAFQIKDDILDLEGNSEIVGKPLRSDERNNKSTFVTLLGLKAAKERLKFSVEQAVEAVKPIKNSEFLIEMAAYIAQRDK